MASTKRTAVILAVSALSSLSAGAQEWARCTSEDGTVKMEVAVVNINEATGEQLQYLYRVGPATAAKIVAGRPYVSPVDVLRVRGLGAAWWRSNGLHVVIEGETTLAVKVGQVEETEPYNWQCDDGREVRLEVEPNDGPPVAGGGARRVVQ